MLVHKLNKKQTQSDLSAAATTTILLVINSATLFQLLLRAGTSVSFYNVNVYSQTFPPPPLSNRSFSFFQLSANFFSFIFCLSVFLSLSTEHYCRVCVIDCVCCCGCCGCSMFGGQLVERVRESWLLIGRGRKRKNNSCLK